MSAADPRELLAARGSAAAALIRRVDAKLTEDDRAALAAHESRCARGERAAVLWSVAAYLGVGIDRFRAAVNELEGAAIEFARAATDRIEANEAIARHAGRPEVVA